LKLHDPEYIWADAYLMFESIMALGVKELYYKEAPLTISALPTSLETMH
jgi:hypothetical protein